MVMLLLPLPSLARSGGIDYDHADWVNVRIEGSGN